jgi:D-arginine dehydrogenase
MSDLQYDIAVIGAGMAGASVAAELSITHRVVVIEREDQPGYHSTGRSAALFSEIYGNDVIRALTRASRQFLFDPPEGFAEAPLVRSRGAMFIARQDQRQALDALANQPDVAAAVTRLSPGDAQAICPALRDGYVAAAIHESASVDLEVHELHHGYLRRLKNAGGRLVLGARDLQIDRARVGWRLATPDWQIRASTLVNAAGAWADEIAKQVAVAPLGLTPRKRTAILVDVSANFDAGQWPLVVDIDEQFYFKPDAGLLLLSPADETLSQPLDVWADELDIAIAIERVTAATNLDIRRVKHSWAGLRNFVADRSPVAGFADADPDFFWLAGQGGYGIQTAPALARAAAAILRGDGFPTDLIDHGLSADMLSPHRLLATAAL